LQKVLKTYPAGIQESFLAEKLNEELKTNYSTEKLCSAIARRYQLSCRIHYWSENKRIYYPVSYQEGEYFIPDFLALRKLVEEFENGVHLSQLQELFWQENKWRIPADIYKLCKSVPQFDLLPLPGNCDWLVKVKSGFSIKAEKILDETRQRLEAKKEFQRKKDTIMTEQNESQQKKVAADTKNVLKMDRKKKQQDGKKQERVAFESGSNKRKKLEKENSNEREEKSKRNKSSKEPWFQRLKQYLQRSPEGVSEEKIRTEFFSEDPYFKGGSSTYCTKIILKRAQDFCFISKDYVFYYKDYSSCLLVEKLDLNEFKEVVGKGILLSEFQSELARKQKKLLGVRNMLEYLKHNSLTIEPTKDRKNFFVTYTQETNV